ncbi:hypothetical protein [Paraburkholderia sp. MM6662-R1]|uniref:hypothetical protein n=1 Tax=Paraburkholderia sp. MM6662-R1 TaxID=2991066 RepID=UPI003D1D21D1
MDAVDHVAHAVELAVKGVAGVPPIGPKVAPCDAAMSLPSAWLPARLSETRARSARLLTRSYAVTCVFSPLKDAALQPALLRIVPGLKLPFMSWSAATVPVLPDQSMVPLFNTLPPLSAPAESARRVNLPAPAFAIVAREPINTECAASSASAASLGRKTWQHRTQLA